MLTRRVIGLLFAALLLTVLPARAQSGKDIQFFSEGVVCHGRMFVPAGFSASSKAAGVVLAPGAGDTASTIESYAARLASQGLVALVIDYRGWGRSGAFIYMAEPIRWDDRLRFSQHTAKVRLRRKRLIPEAQITDIRNAITYLQGEPGVDRTRIGVWGADLAGGHAVSIAAMDARVKAAVAHAPVLAGKDQPRAAWKPTAAEQADMVRLARLGAPTVTAATAGTANDPESRLALAQYRPFHALDAIPQTTAVLFVVGGNETALNAETAMAASKTVKGPTAVTTIPGGSRVMSAAASDAAATAAAAWFAKHLVAP